MGARRRPILHQDGFAQCWRCCINQSVEGTDVYAQRRKTSDPEGVYRVRNWSEYNTGLIARGNVTMWIDESVLTNAVESGARKRGRPCVYADAAIQMLLGLK
jgi:hypothetical protein